MRLKMRNLATCYNEHAIKVSDSYCSGNSNKIHVPLTFIPSIQDEVSLLYKVELSTQTLMFITLTWSTHNIDFAFTVNIKEHHSNSSKSFYLRKIKGSKKLEPFDFKIELIWDLTKAIYEVGPEPVKGYFVALLINSEMISIGDIEDSELKKLVLDYPFAKCCLVSRSERFLGNDEYASRAKFFDTGMWHDILITCVVDDKNSLSMCVCIDKKNVIDVKRLRWNFRGNQTVFLDGMLVDLMWDVHDWFFHSNSDSKSRSRAGIFLFRPRNGLDSRLWLQEKNLDDKEQQKVGASLLICAFNQSYPVALEIIFYIGFLIAFAVKLPILPLHTWLPDTHGEAHYSTCMLLAGILLKMGAYGLIRINMELLPHAHSIFSPWLMVVGTIQIIYAASTSLGQRNLKKRIAYSSVSHMGFILIGIASITDTGLNGAILQIISHGFIGAALFFLAGTSYDRIRLVYLDEMGGVAIPMPKIFTMFSSFSMASLALPGMSGFVAEVLVFLGIITSQKYLLMPKIAITFVMAIGMILTPIYLLSMSRQIFYGYKLFNTPNSYVFDSGPRELFVSISIFIPVIGIGMYPDFVLSLSVDKVEGILSNYFYR
ncbi:putative NADH:quinone oxidoreductase/Mrp antiporter, membrane subunit [Helianthus annuus]|nr:putative NADH:quinone oxidoreductase/Mrp antiporter, membrane subunit [Helianthus annuus]KAJ0574604.1 putative NADH:quinone oxidoreductase/Mrp antiporter, membrane subunit [Helianthus annuus]